MSVNALGLCPLFYCRGGNYIKKTYKIRWKVSRLRRDKRTGVLQPVKQSDYAKYLEMRWKYEQKAD